MSTEASRPAGIKSHIVQHMHTALAQPSYLGQAQCKATEVDAHARTLNPRQLPPAGTAQTGRAVRTCCGTGASTSRYRKL